MKKNVFTFLACLLIANTINAQGTDSDSRDNIHIGIKAGANYSNIYDSEGEEYEADSKIGFAGGLFLSLPLGKYVGIQPEVLFSQKGFKATSSVLGSDVSLTRTTNYIDIPIFLAIKPSRMLTLLVGPQYSYLIKQKDVFTNPITDVDVTQDFEVDDIRKNRLCIVGEIDINLSCIVIGARDGMDLYNNNGDGTSTTPRYKNAWAQATVGFRF